VDISANISARSKCNVSLVIDKSGSMAGEKLKYAKLASKQIVDALNNNDSLSLLTFDQNAEVIVNQQELWDKNGVKSEINKLKGQWQTSMYEALKLANNEILKGESGKIFRIILLTDGKPTDNENPVDYRNISSKMNDEGITITTCGIGDYNEELLTIIAENSGGMWYHIVQPADIEKVLYKEINLIKRTSVSSPKLFMKLPPGFTIDKIYKILPDAHPIENYTMDEESGEITITVSDIISYEAQSYVMKINIDPSSKNKSMSHTTNVIEIGEMSRNYTARLHVGFTTKDEWLVETNPYPRESYDVAELSRMTEKGLYDKTIMVEAQKRTQIVERTIVKESPFYSSVTRLKKIQDKGENLTDEEIKATRAKTRVIR